MQYVKVIIDISHEKVDRPFCYRVPERLLGRIKIGACVEVPFGKGNGIRKGYVIEESEKPDFDEEKIKELCGPADGGFVEERLIRLAAWIREQYGSTMIQALQTVLPVKKQVKAKEKQRIVSLLPSHQLSELALSCEKKHQTAKARLLRELVQTPALSAAFIREKLQISSSTLKSLENQGVIALQSKRDYRNPMADIASGDEKKYLSPAQQNIVEEIGKDYQNKEYKTYLIHGITGSGKTTVYMELIEQVVAGGRSAIVLIPEIALTFQTMMRFQRRFGDRVSILHSGLSQGEKYDQCERAKRGEISIIIGPRSALFTPFKDIGLIVIDEEHEASYKSETAPRYHAREVAEELVKIHGASLILGSATPSLESYYRAKCGEYGLFTLKERLTGGTLPRVYVEDLREELRKGNRSIFSDRLRQLIQDRLEKKEQIMLFLNRRGYAGFISCRSCGHVMKCPHCDVSLSRHRNGVLSCHYCGYEEAERKTCPNCGSPYLMGFKAGTEKIEEQFRREFGDVGILRMDKDTTRKKESYEKILSQFSQGKAQVLIGTQMIVKGHDFPQVTLMGILAADLSLGANDYRAGERTFQLLTQAAGRAGRGKLPGEVVIQSYQPDNYSIRRAARQDYEGFYEEELLYRRLAGYPPVAHLLQIQILAREEKAGKELGEKIRELLESFVEQFGMTCIGPADASIGKINDIYRFSLLLKHKEKKILLMARNQVEKWLETCENEGNIVQFDFNPMQAF
ncbi:MAG: primosomal protein N' [Lachnospiraceae bacterium]